MSKPSQEQMKKLIQQAKNGDEAAIAHLYELYVDRIHRYIAYRVPTTEAEDLTAEVFVRMVEALPSYEYRGAPFESWLYRIAAARVADFHRKTNVAADDVDDEFRDRAMLPEERLLEQQEFEQVRLALAELSDDHQTLLILRFVERKSHKDVADIMGKSLAAVRTMQHRALHHLAQLLEAEGKERHYLRGNVSEDEPAPPSDRNMEP